MNWKDSFFVYVYQFQGEHKESLYWGTYRPHVYFGVRARYANSTVNESLLWDILCTSKEVVYGNAELHCPW
jgi:hypothetical protein